MKSEPLLPLGSFFAILYLVYFTNETIFKDAQLALIFWSIALPVGLLVLPNRAVILSLCFSSLLAFTYFLGFAVNASENVTLEYFPEILITLTCSTWVAGILVGGARWSLPETFHKWFHRAFALGAAGWTFYSIQTIAQLRIADVRDVTGFSYLTTSDLITVFGLSSLSRSKISGIEFLIIFTCCLITVTFLGSRSAMVLFSALSMISFFKNFNILTKVGLIVISVPLLLWWVGSFVDFNSPAFQRLSSLFTLGEDSSLEDRLHFFGIFFENLLDYPACIVVPCHAPSGEYVHSFLSIIEYFGLVGALLVFALLTHAILNIKKLWRSDVLVLFLFTFVSMIATRAWVSMVFAILIGVLLALIAPKVRLWPKKTTFSFE